mmetsp:Transcript_19271/g.23456  ORF Transcript_19271/g.23456 Transcript_19271/m.23456 type:complete len:137 (-) Transcript_19271:524-934(-)
MMFKIEESQYLLEGQSVTAEAVSALRAAKSTQQQLQTKLNPDDIADDLDDMEEMNQDLQEVNDIFNQSADLDIDESDLMAELENFEGTGDIEENPELELPSAPANTGLETLPVAPTKMSFTADDEAALAALEAELL